MADQEVSAAGRGSSTSMGTAALKVFNTTELLEAILLIVPHQTLLPSQRVCRQWKFVIAGSVSINKALFFVTGEASTARLGESKIESAIPHDPRVRKTEFNPASDPEALDRMMEPLASCPAELNPLLSPPREKSTPLPDEVDRFLRCPMVLWDLKPQLLFCHESASCRRMYLTQPPVSLRIFDLDFCSLWAMEPRHPRPHRDPRKFRNVRTFGELIDAVKEKIEGEEQLKIMKCLRIIVGVGPEEVKAWMEEYGGK